MSQRSFESGQEASTNVFKQNRLDGGGINVGRTAGDFFGPGSLNGFVLRIVQTLDERASKVGTFRHGERERFFQNVRRLLRS